MTPEEFFKEFELSVDKPVKTRRELSPGEIFEATEEHPYMHHLVEFIQSRKATALRLSESLAKSTAIDVEAAEALLFELLLMLCFRRTAKEELAQYSVIRTVELLPLKHSILFFTTLRRETIKDARQVEDYATWQFAGYKEECIDKIIKTISDL